MYKQWTQVHRVYRRKPISNIMIYFLISIRWGGGGGGLSMI